MSKPFKSILVFLGILAAAGILAQLVLAQMILGDPGNPRLRMAHQHSGYTVVALALLYVSLSLIAILRAPGSRSS